MQNFGTYQVNTIAEATLCLVVSNLSTISSQIEYIDASILGDTSKVLSIFRKSYGPKINRLEIGYVLISILRGITAKSGTRCTNHFLVGNPIAILARPGLDFTIESSTYRA